LGTPTPFLSSAEEAASAESPPTSSPEKPRPMGFSPPKPPQPDPATKMVQAKTTRAADQISRRNEMSTAKTRLARKNARQIPRGVDLGGPPA